MVKKNQVNADLQPDRTPFHITIATFSKQSMDLDTDIQMLRSGLIYGDKVRLCSYNTSAILSLFSIWNNPLKEFIKWAEKNMSLYAPDTQNKQQVLESLVDHHDDRDG
jgi:hypothetical protein